MEQSLFENRCSAEGLTSKQVIVFHPHGFCAVRRTFYVLYLVLAGKSFIASHLRQPLTPDQLGMRSSTVKNQSDQDEETHVGFNAIWRRHRNWAPFASAEHALKCNTANALAVCEESCNSQLMSTPIPSAKPCAGTWHPHGLRPARASPCFPNGMKW